MIGSGLISDVLMQANYRQIGATDIIADDDRGGAARQLDLARLPTLIAPNPRAAERMATALFLYSVATRGQGRRGATEAAAKAAAFVPDAEFRIADADLVLAELHNPESGMAALERIEGRADSRRAGYFPRDRPYTCYSVRRVPASPTSIEMTSSQRECSV